jgi:hypothetical protein
MTGIVGQGKNRQAANRMNGGGVQPPGQASGQSPGQSAGRPLVNRPVIGSIIRRGGCAKKEFLIFVYTNQENWDRAQKIKNSSWHSIS